MQATAMVYPDENPPTLRENFARNLARLLHERRITNKALADSLGITGAAVTSWLHGRTSPELSRLEAIAFKLRVEPLALFASPWRQQPGRESQVDQLLHELAAVRGKRLIETS